MARLMHCFITIPPRKWTRWGLALCWSGGLICGIILFALTGNTASLMEQAASCGVSLRNLMLANLLPFLFSAFAVYLRQPKLIFLIAFFRGCLFSYVSIGTVTAFGSAGWLVQILLMFSDLLLTVLLYFYWLRHISGLQRFSAAQSAAVVASVFLMASVEYWWIAPILVRVL